MPKTMFNIQLRISEEIIDLPVIEDDTNATLLDRLCDYESVRRQFRKILNLKINESLANILKRKNLEGELRDKIQRFLNPEAEIPQTKIKMEHSENKPKKLESRGEWVPTRNYSIPTSSKHQTSHTIPQIPHLNLMKERKLMQIPETKKSNVVNCRKGSNGGQKEIITAYETVYSKCKDPELKVMIKKTLEELERSDGTDGGNRAKNPKSTPIQSITRYCQPANPELVYQSPAKQQFRPCLQPRSTPNHESSMNTSIHDKIPHFRTPSVQLQSKSTQKYPHPNPNPQKTEPTQTRDGYLLHHKSLTHVQSAKTQQSKSKSRSKRYNYLSYDSIY